MRRALCLGAWGVFAAIACGGTGAERSDTAKVDTGDASGVSTRLATRCYRSANSVLLGPRISGSRNNGQGPGWIRIEGSVTDSGEAELVDANRAGLSATWRRGPADSLSLTAADDFLRVELRIAVSDSVATGSALARSDATAERDSTGQHRDLQRAWTLRATRVPCDSMPARPSATSEPA
jgi:hypothetical protein